MGVTSPYKDYPKALKVNISPSHLESMKKSSQIFVLIESTKHMDPYMSMLKEIVKYLFNTLESQPMHIIRFDSTMEYVYGLNSDRYTETLDGIGFVSDKEESSKGFADALNRVRSIIDNNSDENKQPSYIMVFGKGRWTPQTEEDFENPVYESIQNNALYLENKNKFITFLLGKDTKKREIRDLLSKNYYSIYKIQSDFYHQIRHTLNQCFCPAYVEVTPTDCYVTDISLNLMFKVFPRDNLNKFESVTIKVYRDSGATLSESSTAPVTFEQPFYKSIDTGLKTPKRIKFDLIIGEETYQGEIEPHISWFLRNIKFGVLAHTIAFLGLRGVGKSTTINGIFNLLSCQPRIFEKNIAGFLNDHVTLEINKTIVSDILDWFDHPLAMAYKGLFGNMTIYDVPGHEVGHTKVGVQTIDVERLCQQFKPDTIIIPFSLQNNDELDIKYVNQTVEILRSKNISPILVLTFADRISLADLESTKKALMKALSFDPSNVFELVNYSDETFRNFDKDVTIFNIFSKAIENSIVCKNMKKINPNSN
ncbi:hypothetical protein CYY_009656 [Polysphondylium violaceum]|uniref:VWFA domain-containing protein n=1 Tax=Polysphondylium violaceum TaxID=133409 RepID=A0A8J4PJT5_9MYCE|nr:hypothetical protein CYY_009656 [Polysphondylium violaceum]